MDQGTVASTSEGMVMFQLFCLLVNTRHCVPFGKSIFDETKIGGRSVRPTLLLHDR